MERTLAGSQARPSLRHGEAAFGMNGHEGHAGSSSSAPASAGLGAASAVAVVPVLCLRCGQLNFLPRDTRLPDRGALSGSGTPLTIGSSGNSFVLSSSGSGTSNTTSAAGTVRWCRPLGPDAPRVNSAVCLAITPLQSASSFLM